jgi:hypothetical protein
VAFYRDDMLMSLKIGLYHDSVWSGEVELDSIFVMEPADYTCQSEDAVTFEEVRQIAKMLRRVSGIETGVVGSYNWCADKGMRKAPLCPCIADEAIRNFSQNLVAFSGLHGRA